MDVHQIFPDDVIELANTFINLQNNIFSLNSRNLNQIIDFLFDSESDYINRFVPQIAHYLYFATIIRQEKIENYIELYKFLVSQANDSNDLGSINEYFLDFVFIQPPSKSDITIKNGPISFLRRLYIEEVISIETILARIAQFIEKYPKCGNVYLLFFCWFIPEIEQNQPDLYTKQISMFDSKQLLMFPHYFVKFFKNIDELRSNNWEHFHFLTKYHYSPSSIEYFISIDDVFSLQAHALEIDFLNTRIECTLFETNYILQNQPTLFQFAVAHKAEKCAKFFLLNNARMHELEYGKYPTSHFAISVENLEFLHILQQERCNFCGAFNVAAFYHQDNIIEWLNTHDLQTSNTGDFVNDSILHCCVITENYSIIIDSFQKGIDINFQDRTKQTILYEAARTNHQDLVEFLLTHPKINPNIHAI